VKEIQNTKSGVYGFWLKAMLNHPEIGKLIEERDRAVLQHLTKVECQLHGSDYGYDLIFSFEPNEYFEQTELKKTFHLAKPNVIEKCEGTTISWKDGRNVTEKKVKKKQHNKKTNQKRTVTKTVQCDSFFNFFKSEEMPDEKELEKMEGEEEKNFGEKMDQDFDTGNDMKD